MPKSKPDDEARKNLRKTDRNKAKVAKDKQNIRKHLEKQVKDLNKSNKRKR